MKFFVDNILVNIDDGLSTIRKKTAERLGAHVQKLRVEVVSRRWVRNEEGGAIRLSVIAETNEFLRSTSSFPRPEEVNLHTEPLPWKCRPVVVGFGLPGIVAALYLAKRGLKPLVLERGSSLNDRSTLIKKKVAFSTEGEGSVLAQIGSLLLSDNLDPRLKLLLAEEGIRFDGPDAQRFLSPLEVRSILSSLRQRIIAYGGEVLFGVNYLGVKKRFGKIKGVLFEESGVAKFFKTEKVLLTFGACDDTFYLGTSIPALAPTFNECVFGKKTIDDRYPLFLAEQTAKGPNGKTLLVTGLKGARVVDIGAGNELCLQAYCCDGKGRHVHSFIGVEVGKEEGEKVCKNAFDATKPARIPCSCIADFYAKRTPLRLGQIKPEKTTDIRLDNFSKILGGPLAKRFASAIGQFAKAYPYLDGTDSVMEGLFLLAGCKDGQPRKIDDVYVSCVPANACMDFASKATSGFKAAILMCE